MSVVIGGVIFQNQMSQRAANLDLSALPPAVAAALTSGSAGSSTTLVNALPPAQKQPVLDAYAASLSTMWIFYTVTGLCSFAASLAIGKRVLSKEHTEVKTGIAAQEEERVERNARHEERREGKRRSKRVSAGDLEKGIDGTGNEGEGKVEV